MAAGPWYVRVSIRWIGGGGFRYDLDLREEPVERTGDLRSVSHGVPLGVDPHSALLLCGAEIGWKETAEGGGFHFDNPNAVSAPDGPG
jgi:iron-sulfur cluster assembly protein